jgi:hypothetical protein
MRQLQVVLMFPKLPCDVLVECVVILCGGCTAVLLYCCTAVPPAGVPGRDASSSGGTSASRSLQVGADSSNQQLTNCELVIS